MRIYASMDERICDNEIIYGNIKEKLCTIEYIQQPKVGVEEPPP